MKHTSLMHLRAEKMKVNVLQIFFSPFIKYNLLAELVMKAVCRKITPLIVGNESTSASDDVAGEKES